MSVVNIRVYITAAWLACATIALPTFAQDTPPEATEPEAAQPEASAHPGALPVRVAVEAAAVHQREGAIRSRLETAARFRRLPAKNVRPACSGAADRHDRPAIGDLSAIGGERFVDCH